MATEAEDLIEDTARPHRDDLPFRGPCGGRGRAARMCREMSKEDDMINCKVVGCKRGNRRGFRCTCRHA